MPARAYCHFKSIEENIGTKMAGTAPSVVELKEHNKEIVVLTMHDSVNKNTFSLDLVNGLRNAFNAIRESGRYKAVVLTGYGNYFCSGGTKDALLALHEGHGNFQDVDIYRLPLDCPVPVISAMQGHGIGGGFVLGLFSDIVILSRESIYTANFMKYGFTPGMGATWILPQKLGISLAQEMLLTARNFRGEELEKRGIPFSVLPRAQVLNHALNMADELSKAPRLSLMTLKEHLNRRITQALPDIIAEELKMHSITMHQPEVYSRIQALFGK